MKIVCISFLSLSLFSATLKQKYDFAHIYADGLVRQFDEELKTNKSFLKSETYSKILKSREYIESLGYEANIEHNKKVVELLDTKSYNDTVKQINNLNLPIKYPSAGSAGNVIGTEYPKNTWSLTFDDGPRGQRTRTIVDKLYERGMKATFFMLTAEVKKYLGTAQYVMDSGMEVALHSYTHKSLSNPSAARVKYEITQAKKDMEHLLGIELKNFRLPYGAGLRTKITRQEIAKNNLMHIFWNVDTLDWKDKNPESVFKRTIIQMKNSPNNAGIILFHDIQKPTVITSEMVMDYLQENDLAVCTVEEGIKAINKLDNECEQ